MSPIWNHQPPDTRETGRYSAEIPLKIASFTPHLRCLFLSAIMPLFLSSS